MSTRLIHYNIPSLHPQQQHQQKRLQSDLEERERRQLLRLQELENRELTQPSSMFAWQPSFSTLKFRWAETYPTQKSTSYEYIMCINPYFNTPCQHLLSDRISIYPPPNPPNQPSPIPLIRPTNSSSPPFASGITRLLNWYCHWLSLTPQVQGLAPRPA